MEGDKEERARSRKAAGRHTAFVGSAQYAPSAYADRRGARRPRLSSTDGVVLCCLFFSSFRSGLLSSARISTYVRRVSSATQAGRTERTKATEQEKKKREERGFSSAAAAAAAVAVLFSTGSREERASFSRRWTNRGTVVEEEAAHRGFYTLADTGLCAARFLSLSLSL